MNRIVATLVASLLASAGTAYAQEASVVEGTGYPLGEGSVLHPTLGAELGFTDNVFYEERNQAVSGIMRLLLAGAIASKEIPEDEPVDPLIDNEETAEPAKQEMQFRAGGQLGYHEYLSTNSNTRAQRTLSADLNGHLVIAPQGTISLLADERFLRDTRPTNFESTEDTNRIANSLALGMRYQPGGRTITGTLRWENQIDIFEDGEQDFADRMINTFHARGEWTFFPFTKAFADLSYGFVSGLGSSEKGASPIRGGVGIATALTEMLTIKAHVGWAHATYSDGVGYNQPLLGLEVGYRYSPLGRVVGGYQYDARDSINAAFYRDHALTARVDQQFGRIVGSVGGDLRLRGYRGVHSEITGGAMTTSRDDVIFAVSARAQYILKDWIAVVADYRTEIDQTEFISAEPNDPSYTRTEITVGVRAAL